MVLIHTILSSHSPGSGWTKLPVLDGGGCIHCMLLIEDDPAPNFRHADWVRLVKNRKVTADAKASSLPIPF